MARLLFKEAGAALCLECLNENISGWHAPMPTWDLDSPTYHRGAVFRRSGGY